MKIAIYYFMVVSLASCLAGCAASHVDGVVRCDFPSNSRPAPHGPAFVSQHYGMIMTPIPVDAVQFASQFLADRIAIQGLYAQQTATGTVHLSARLASCSDKPMIIMVRTSFLKQNLAPAEPVSAWQRVFLNPRSISVYEINSLSGKDVTNYLIEVGPSLNMEMGK